MNRRRLGFPAVLLAVALGFAAAGAELTILQTSDLHGHTERFPGIAECVRRERLAAGPAGALWIDCGDIAQGSFAVVSTRGMRAIEFLNAAGCDVWVPGNHDFEFGVGRLAELAKQFRGVTLGADWRIPGLTPAGSVVLERGGRRIGVIGLGEPALAERLGPETGLIATGLETALRGEVVKLRKRRCDLVVLAIHCGRYFRGGSLGKILRKFPEIALVLGAHTHQEEPGVSIGTAWYVQGGFGGKVVAAARIDFPEGERPRIVSELLPVPIGPADPVPAADRAEFHRAPVALRAAGRAESESPLNRLALSAMLRAARADAALYIATAGRPGDPEFIDISRFALYRLFPYENRICAVELDRPALEAILNEAFAVARKRKLVVAFSGFSRDARTGKIEFPAGKTRLRTAVSDYYLGGAGGILPELGKHVRDASARDTGVPLRNAAEAVLRNSAAPDGPGVRSGAALRETPPCAPAP